MSDWYQQALTPPHVLELNMRLGIIPESDHCQVLVEMKDPVTGILIAQWSVPHARLADWPHLLSAAHTKAEDLINDTVEPF